MIRWWSEAWWWESDGWDMESWADIHHTISLYVGDHISEELTLSVRVVLIHWPNYWAGPGAGADCSISVWTSVTLSTNQKPDNETWSANQRNIERDVRWCIHDQIEVCCLFGVWLMGLLIEYWAMFGRAYTDWCWCHPQPLIGHSHRMLASDWSITAHHNRHWHPDINTWCLHLVWSNQCNEWILERSQREMDGSSMRSYLGNKSLKYPRFSRPF